MERSGNKVFRVGEDGNRMRRRTGGERTKRNPGIRIPPFGNRSIRILTDSYILFPYFYFLGNRL